ncbi:MAG TPA: bifunctional YncE family protein/alkaline phosphatase family protein, partial [Bacteroidales bacterium]
MMSLNIFARILVFGISLLLFEENAVPQLPGTIEQDHILLPNGWKITRIGKSLPLGDLPLNIVISPSKKLLAVTNNGQSTQTVQLIDAQKQGLLDSVVMKKSWLGLAFSEDEKSLYASGGNDNWIVKYTIANRHLIPSDTIILGKPWPEKISIAGITLDDKRHLLYAVTKENNSLYVINTESKKVIERFDLKAEGYTCLLSPDKRLLYISCWGGGEIEIFDTEKLQFRKPIIVGSNPNDLCMTTKGTYLFVANANDNTVSVIDLKKNDVIETLNAALFPNSPSGSTTNSVALSEDEKTLYVANADNNCLAIFDISNPGKSKSKGFIPTGWYPTCVRVVHHTIFVANGKGFSSMANPHGPNPFGKDEGVYYQQGSATPLKVQYIAGLFLGTLSIIREPDDKALAQYSQTVYHNAPYNKEKENWTEGKDGNPVPYKPGMTSPIKYVFYIIKENRTYDQVLGDLPEGNGDTSLVLFGEKITPNQHALAHDFVLLDNFYVDSEVSADGHNWSTGAYATDYLEKTWPTSYGRRGGTYDSEGRRAIANNKNGFIWDFCKRAGVTYRTYGEFADNYKPNIPVLKGHYCPYFTGWDQSVRDTVRFSQWKRDFDSLVNTGNLPQLNTLRFINDHTEGVRIGRPTPFANLADNDLAVGLFVDHLSHSKIWDKSVVFIVEDDAQNGPDHVDAHRSIAFVAGGFVKQGYVDHTMYSTSSILRTMELILNLPPMSQYDAAATPMWRCFSETASHPA